MAERDLDEWDAEIEADFQRVVRGAKATGQRKPGKKHIGCPLAFAIDVCRLTEGRTTLIVAQLIYRRTHVCRDPTVTLPADELAGFDINRRDKNKALTKLEVAGLIRIERTAPGRSTKVTLTWKPS